MEQNLPDSTGLVTTSLSSSSSSAVVAGKSPVTQFLPPCRICEATASGFHYGVNTCEACKAFFRRCTSPGSVIKPCLSGGNCTETIRGRLTCVACRFEQCQKVGMTKSGSKKGRYTHELRTQYTNEIKGEPPSSTPTSTSSMTSTTNSKVVQKPVTTPANYSLQTSRLQEQLDDLVKCAKDCFPEMREYMTLKDEIDKRTNMILSEYVLDSIPTKHIYSPGPQAEIQPFKQLDDMLTSALRNRSSMPDQSTCAVNILWSSWMSIAEALFLQLTNFAKKLPGFRQLSLDDQIILLKGARLEVSTFIAHPSCVPDKRMIGMYCPSSGELLLAPVNLFPGSNFTERFTDEHIRVMERLKKGNYNLEDMSVIIAFLLLTEREGLQNADQVEKLQQDLLAVLKYTLLKNHQDTPNIFAETLLALPQMREHSETLHQLLNDDRDATRPDLSPLMEELLR